MMIPKQYIPKSMNPKDQSIQKRELEKSRERYKHGEYYTRKKLKSFQSRSSKHIKKAQQLYNVDTITPSEQLAEKTKCSVSALEKIVQKGRGAYFSSGSRPNQTPESWGLARLASAITGGNASAIDYSILENGCSEDSLARKAARKRGGHVEKHELFKYSDPIEAQRKATVYKDLTLYASTNPKKKYMIYDGQKWIHFGEMGYEDFTKHKDLKRRENYLKRTAKIRGNWKKTPLSPNNLSRNILW